MLSISANVGITDSKLGARCAIGGGIPVEFVVARHRGLLASGICRFDQHHSKNIPQICFECMDTSMKVSSG